MGARWRADLAADGVAPARVDELVDASHAQARRRARRSCSAASPGTASTATPTRRRQRAEWGMALLSLGAAVENLMLTAADAGLASCWVAAPIFCPEEARDALALPAEWLPHALVLVGHPDPALRRPDPPAGPARRAPRASRSASAASASAGALALEVLEGAGDALFERRPRLPAEVDPGAARVERAALHLAGARRVVARVLLEAR